MSTGPFAGIRRNLAFMREHERLMMISVSTVLVMAGQGVVGPILPLFAREFGVGAAAVGLTLSVFALARLILNVPLGILADRYGRRMLLVAGPLVTGVGMMGSGLSQSLGELLAWRFLAGAGSAMYMTAAMIYIADISTPENRARYIGTNQGALLLGVSIGPAAGGLIAEAFGLRAPFYVVGAAALTATIYAYLRLPETRPETPATAPPEALSDAAQDRDTVAAPPAPPAPPRPWLRMLRSRDFMAVSFVTMSIFFTRTASRQTLVPLLAVSRLGMTPGVLGGIFAAMSLVNMVLITPSAMAADRFGRKAVIVPGGVLLAVGLLVFAQADTYVIFFVASAVLAIGQGIDGPAPAAYAADIAPAEVRGLAMGLYRTSGDLGFVIGPPLLGALADATSFGWGLAANAVLVAFAAITFGFVARETTRRSGGAEKPQAVAGA